MASTLKYRHPQLGFGMAVPEDWERIDDSPGATLIVVEPAVHPERFRPNLVVTIEQFTPGITPGQWHARTIQLLGRYLNGFRLTDLQATDADQQVECRTLGHHATAAGPVTVEQWLRFDPAHCYTVTASAGELEYADYCELFRSIAGSLRLPAELR